MTIRILCSSLFALILFASVACAQGVQPPWALATIAKLQSSLGGPMSEAQRARLAKGMAQVANFWRAGDGDAAAFEEFVRANFAADAPTLDTMFTRFEYLLEQLDGHMGEIGREFRSQSD